MTRSRSSVALLALVWMAAQAAAARAANPEDPGPYRVAITSTSVAVGPIVPLCTLSQRVPVQIYHPASPASGTFPVIALFHGICPGTPSHMAGLATLLASHGYVAVNMETRLLTTCDAGPCLLTDVHDLLKLLSTPGLDQIQARMRTVAPLVTIDRRRRGIGGHSRGGLTSALAAENPIVDGEPIPLAAVLLLDPKARAAINVEGTTTDLPPIPVGSHQLDSLARADRMSAPVGILAAEGVFLPNLVGCDPDRLMQALPQSLRQMGLRVRGANHGDAISWPVTDPARYRLFQRYSMAFLNYYLKGQAARSGMAAWVDRDGAGRLADHEAGGIQTFCEGECIPCGVEGTWEKTTDLSDP